jgi:phage shock protein PspC (stress-responsive transcriptional regulator)
VDLGIVNAVLNQTGPVGTENRQTEDSHYYRPGDKERIRKFFRDADGKKLAGVCSGLALYLNIDVSLIRILFLVVFFFGSAGGWVYLVLWIIAPEARTAAEKCEMRGIPPTAENIRRFSEGR